MKQSTRRKVIVGISAGVSMTIAGCSSNGSDVQDTDGDGVIDSEDYAPRDADVQSESDIESTDDTQSSAESDDTSTDNGQTEPESESDEEPTTNDGEVTYPSHSGTHEITARENYWVWEFSVEKEFILEYRAVNMLDENHDFDILLYDSSRFEEYRALANEVEEGVRPEYIDGSAPGISSGAEASDIQLPAGEYYLVIDNTDLSDAGDWGTEDTRRVRLEASTEPV